MMGRSFLLRCAAFFLLLVFSQKAGAGLLLHNFFHSTTATEQEKGKTNETGYSCTCIDDFLTPFDEAVAPVYDHPATDHPIPLTIFAANIPFITLVLSLLRGPPTVIA